MALQEFDVKLTAFQLGVLIGLVHKAHRTLEIELDSKLEYEQELDRKAMQMYERLVNKLVDVTKEFDI